MGVSLPKPVMTAVLEREGSELFRIGGSSINGYRENMEDAHLNLLRDTWGFFGVFDGHVNEHCSAYLEEAWRAELSQPNVVPMTDERMKELALKIDKEFVDAQRDGGSTGTFFVAVRDGNRMKLQVGNVGDSRILIGRKGMCIPMTDDHKPTNDGERRRIESCGGRVENGRVDGSLAVSRAFGDRDYKQWSEGDQLQQRVIALADVTHEEIEVNSDDFVVLACDGVFESNFTNEEVVEFVTQQLTSENDLALVANAVCEEAVKRGSRDNISCVIVQMKDGTSFRKDVEVKIGAFNAPNHPSFRRMYEKMCSKGGLPISKALETRFDFLTTEESDEALQELEAFAGGPPKSLEGAARTQWFADWFAGLESAPSAAQPEDPVQRIQMLQQQLGIPIDMLLSMMEEANGSGQAEE